MSNNEWLWQGFFGPMAAAQAGKAIADALSLAVVGVMVPPTGDGPMSVDPGGVFGMFAVQTRADAPLSVPAGMYQAEPAMVGRMVGA